jgi:hypothetical protein
MYGRTLYNVHGTHRGKRRLKLLLIIIESYQIGWKTWGEGRRDISSSGWTGVLCADISPHKTATHPHKMARTSMIYHKGLFRYLVHMRPFYCTCVICISRSVKGVSLQSLTPVFFAYFWFGFVIICTDPDPDPVFWLILNLLFLKTDVNVLAPYIKTRKYYLSGKVNI